MLTATVYNSSKIRHLIILYYCMKRRRDRKNLLFYVLYRISYILQSIPDKSYHDIIKFHGFKLANGVVINYINICEHVKQDENSDVESVNNNLLKQKNRKKKEWSRHSNKGQTRARKNRKEKDNDYFYWKFHGSNETQNKKKCWTLNTKLKKKKWKESSTREMMVLEKKTDNFLESSNKRLQE